jgi:hypothetical protein
VSLPNFASPRPLRGEVGSPSAMRSMVRRDAGEGQGALSITNTTLTGVKAPHPSPLPARAAQERGEGEEGRRLVSLRCLRVHFR